MPVSIRSAYEAFANWLICEAIHHKNLVLFIVFVYRRPCHIHYDRVCFFYY
jgi:hypothetical protein